MRAGLAPSTSIGWGVSCLSALSFASLLSCIWLVSFAFNCNR